MALKKIQYTCLKKINKNQQVQNLVQKRGLKLIFQLFTFQIHFKKLKNLKEEKK